MKQKYCLFIYPIIPVISTPHKNGDGCEKGHVDEDWGRAVAVAESGLMSDDR